MAAIRGAGRWGAAFAVPTMLAGPALAQDETGPDWMWHFGLGWGGMMFGGGLLMLVFWGGIIVLIVMLARWAGGFGPAEPPVGRSHQSALEILDERFARGEIDKQEYEDRKRTLAGAP